MNTVISMQNASARRLHITKQFKEKEVSFNFFDALNPAQGLELAQSLKLVIEPAVLTAGEIGCMMSHICLWKSIVDENKPYMVIFEDDIYLSDRSKRILSDLTWLPKSSHLIKLEKTMDYCKLMGESLTDTLPKVAIKRIKTPYYGAAGYIITQKGARFLLKYFSENRIDKPFDVILFKDLLMHPELNISLMNPTICIQDHILNKADSNFPSLLTADRNKLRMADIQGKKTTLYKLGRELKRPLQQLYQVWKVFLKHVLYTKVDFY